MSYSVSVNVSSHRSKTSLTFNFVEDDAGVFWVKLAKIWLSRLFAKPAVNALQVATLGWPLHPMS